MSIHLPLPFHVFDCLNRLRARTESAELALHVVALLSDGAHVVRYFRNGPTRTLWTKGKEATQSLDDALVLMRERLEAPV